MRAKAGEPLLALQNALLTGQKRVLEMIATRTPLEDTLLELTRFIEAQEAGLRCGILVVDDDGRHFRDSVGPSLPEAYLRALAGAPIGPPYRGPCGPAVRESRAIDLPDIRADERWPDWREMALTCGLAACRSTPVIGPDGRVLASFAVYFDHPRDPRPAQPELIEIATHLAGIALERERAQQLLRDRERHYRELLEALPAAIYTTDAAGHITFYNEAAVELAGRRPQLGHDEWCVSWQLKSPDGAALPLDRCPMAVALKENRPIRGAEIVVERPDGVCAPVLAFPTPLHDGSGALAGAVNMLVDITERKQVEQALRRSEERLAAELAGARRLQQTSTALIQENDVAALYGQIIDAAIDLMGSDMASMQMLHPERDELRLLAFKGFDAESAAGWEWVGRGSGSSCAAALNAGRRVFVSDIETCDFIDRGAYRRAGIRAVQSTPLRSRSGRLLGMISTHWTKPHRPAESDLQLFDVLARQAADLIERRQAEEALKRLAESLEEHVAERTRQLTAEIAERRKAEAALRQSQKMEAMGQLTGGVAHDFNNILAVITGNLDLLEKLAEAEPAARRLVDAAQKAAEQGARLTQQLLAFSRRQALRPRVVDLRRTVAESEELLRRVLGEAIEVSVAADPRLWLCRIDTGQFENSLLNLAVNARDAMPKGGRLTITLDNAEIGEPGGENIAAGAYIRLAVADTGQGIPPDLLDRVLEPFFTTKDAAKGTGLGLSQVYGFVSQSGGHLRIRSTPGLGTTVEIYLPKAPNGAAAAAERDDDGDPEPPAGFEKILVVEDDPAVRTVTVAALEALGYEVLAARDGPEALSLLEGDAPIDVLFTDVVMPHGMDGGELARRARQLRPGIRVLLASGYPDGDLVTADLPILNKPYRTVELAGKLRALLASGNRKARERASAD